MSARMDEIRERLEAVRSHGRQHPEDTGGRPDASYSAGFIEEALAKEAFGDSDDPVLREHWRLVADFLAEAQEDVPYLLAELDSMIRGCYITAEKRIKAEAEVQRLREERDALMAGDHPAVSEAKALSDIIEHHGWCQFGGMSTEDCARSVCDCGYEGIVPERDRLRHERDHYRNEFIRAVGCCEQAEAEAATLREVVQRVGRICDEWRAWSRARSTPRIDAFRDAADAITAALGAAPEGDEVPS